MGMVAAALCPMHGPVVRTSVTELVGQYRQASKLLTSTILHFLFSGAPRSDNRAANIPLVATHIHCRIGAVHKAYMHNIHGPA